jgi:hypothetical protein
MDTHILAAHEGHHHKLSPTLLRCLLRQIDAALPASATPEIAADNQQAAHELFFAMHPHDAVEAAAAVLAVTAHFAAIDLHARASRPGLSDETVMRLRAAANACARPSQAARRGNKTSRSATAARKPPAEPEPEAEAEPLERPQIYQFQPRNRFGQPIPLANWEEMTMAQRRATYAPKRDPEVEAAAIADEEAMIAEQRALDAKSRPTQ